MKIWNTPFPPSEALCRADLVDTNSCQFLRVVELDDIKGITFFFIYGALSGVHVHYSDESCAMDTYTRELNDRGREAVVWIYLPISTRDQVLLLGTRRALQSESGDRCILFRTKLAGDIIIGKEMRENVEDNWLAAPAPVAMLYGDPKPGRNITFFGGHNRALSPDPALLRPFHQPGPGSVLLGQAYFSWAPLSSVSSAVVFSDESTGACRGILFCYHDGGARAVGQCRLHVDSTASVLRPARICFQVDSDPDRINKTAHTPRVKFKGARSGGASSKVEEGWESRQMEGIIKFWISYGDNYQSSYLEVGK